MKNEPTIIHTSSAVFVKHNGEYIYINEADKMFPLLKQYKNLAVDLLNELTVAFIEQSQNIAKEFHLTGVFDMCVLAEYIKAMRDYTQSVNNDYTQQLVSKI